MITLEKQVITKTTDVTDVISLTTLRCEKNAPKFHVNMKAGHINIFAGSV